MQPRTLTAAGLLFLALLPGAALADERPSIALLPCEPLVEATPRVTSWLDGKLRRELGTRARLVPLPAINAALAEREIERPSACDDACLAELGAALGADRVVRQSLSMQSKVQSKGTAWIWIVHQVAVDGRRPFGHFERMCMCPRSAWDRIAREHATRLLRFDPAARLELGPVIPAQPTAGPVARPGMVFVPEGPFIMGSENGEFDEEPRHRVWLDAFYIDQHETTNAEYARCVEAGACERQSVSRLAELMGQRQPVVGVGWYDATAYCAFVGKRLPTEAEWEKAARGTDERRYPWGDDWRPRQVNMHGDADGFATTAPVGSFPENVSPYGAYDMAGNAWEWTADWWSRSYYRESPERNPRGPRTGDRRVMRGGSWMYDVPFFAGAANRSPGTPRVRKRYVGFRCAMDGNAPSPTE